MTSPNASFDAWTTDDGRSNDASTSYGADHRSCTYSSRRSNDFSSDASTRREAGAGTAAGTNSYAAEAG